MAFTFTFATSMLLLSVLVVIASASDGYGSGSSINYPNLDQKPKLEDKEKSLSTTLGIQGLIYCKSASNLIPLEGAVARITCVATDENGYETAPFSILSGATDGKGYFFATLSPYEVQHGCRLKECKAFLELSPMETCNIPTDINEGISGALLASHRLLNDKNMKLFSLKPFYFTSSSSEPTKPISNNGY